VEQYFFQEENNNENDRKFNYQCYCSSLANIGCRTMFFNTMGQKDHKLKTDPDNVENLREIPKIKLKKQIFNI